MESMLRLAAAAALILLSATHQSAVAGTSTRSRATDGVAQASLSLGVLCRQTTRSLTNLASIAPPQQLAAILKLERHIHDAIVAIDPSMRNAGLAKISRETTLAIIHTKRTIATLQMANTTEAMTSIRTALAGSLQATQEAHRLSTSLCTTPAHTIP
jgi:hypothetical protein